MFTKKYVGPVDCASCEKGIVNLNGLRAENVNWNRLPFREPTERIAKVTFSSFYQIYILVWIRLQQILSCNWLNSRLNSVKKPKWQQKST
jgi:hypothetical protein